MSIIEFYSHNPKYNFCQFSNFYYSPFEYFLPQFAIGNGFPDKVICENSEKAIMLSKAALMNDQEIFYSILNNSDPSICKILGRKVKNFNQNLWNNNINDIAFNVLYQKFYSNPELIKILLDTNESIIVEATVKDKIWGIGLNCGDPNIQFQDKWKGQNILGFTLMKVRDKFKNN